MNFTLGEIADRYKVAIGTIKRWNTVGDRILNRLATLNLFIEETDFTKKDLEAVKVLLDKKEDYSLKAKARKAEKKFREYFWRAKNFELAVELYALKLSKDELKNLYNLKTGGIKK